MAPIVGANLAMSPVVGLSNSASDNFARFAKVASRVLLKRSRYSTLEEKPFGGSIFEASLLWRSANPAGSGGYVVPGKCLLTNCTSELMRCPSCQAIWLAVGAGRTSRSSSERSDEYLGSTACVDF